MFGFFSDSALEHIFKGNASGGFHFEGLADANGKVVSIVTPPDANGVYEATVEISGKVKAKPSTFFPKKWSIEQVISTIEEAYNSSFKVNTHGNVYKALTSSGITVEMYIDNAGKLVSAFPLMEVF